MGGASGRSGRKHIRNSTADKTQGVSASSSGISRKMRRGSGTGAMGLQRTRDAANAVFEQFKDADDDKIGPESLERLFDALELDPLDVTALIFAWKLRAKTPCEFTRSEFVDGLLRLNVDSLRKLKVAVSGLRSMIDSPDDFRSFYIYSFDYNKPPGQKSMPIEIARQLWPLLLADRFVHMDIWLEFLQTRSHAITRDSYVLFLDFVNTIEPDLSNFDEDGGAWPVLVDEFVEFARPKLRAAGLDPDEPRAAV